jgi:hypothetical protein
MLIKWPAAHTPAVRYILKLNDNGYIMRNIYTLLICIFIISCNSKNKDNNNQKEIIVKKNLINLPKYSVVKSGYKDLLQEIKLVRNEIFARYGREFKTQDYKSYFSKFEWYKPNKKYGDTLLTKNDLRDIKILKNYEDSLKFLNEKETAVIKTALNLIKKFRYNNIDTTIYSFGYIDSDNIIDTVNTSFKLINNKIVVQYDWQKNNSSIWKYDHEDPYYWISNSKLFEYGTRDIWIVLAIAIKKCVFEIKNKSDFDAISPELAASNAHYFEKSVEEKQFLEYINDYIKHIVLYSQNESGGNLDFWYDPLNRFIPYYRP